MKALNSRAVALAMLCLLGATGVLAQDVQPKVYTPAPVGVNLITLGYAFSSGEVLFDKTIPVEDATADIHSFNAAYSRSIGLFGLAGRADIALSFVTGDWEGDVAQTGQTTSRTGFGDPIFRFALFVFGAPALKREQFAGFHPKTIVGATLRLRLPLGQYYSDKIVNLGSNRWGISPQVGGSHLVGRLLFEAYAGVYFFTDNDEFLGTSTLSQDPLFTFQVHVGYRFRRGFWIAASTRQSVGGATEVDGGNKFAPEANNRVGLAMAVPVAGRYALRFIATTGTTATVDNDYTTLALAWQVVL